ncbi:MAG: HlyD family efflux transporter periplasmic adaptor subunit [Sphingobacteriales bacterium]|nr:MAG: HlyD family efflux transporter periplasmic adaptor subunit [Sphingobacteriales bacterium]
METRSIEYEQAREEHSEHVRDILGKIPSWTTRWGITLLLSIFVGFLLLASLIKYPDSSTGSIVITTEKPLLKIISPINGRIKTIFKKDYSIVNSDEVLMRINPTHERVQLGILKSVVAEARGLVLGESGIGSNLSFNDTILLGSMQPTYNDLIRNCQILLNNRKDNAIYMQEDELENRKKYLGELIEIANSQLAIAKNEEVNAKMRFEANHKLYLDKVISKFEYLHEEDLFYQKQMEVSNLRKLLTQHRGDICMISKDIAEIKHSRLSQERQLSNEINASIQKLENELRHWEDGQVIIAPRNGRVIYLGDIHIDKYIKAEEALVAIVPRDSSFIGIMSAPANGFGKVQLGQTVKIKLDNYPYREYGQLTGTVKSISLIPENSMYKIKVEFKKIDLIPGKQITLRPEMVGIADIVTEDMTLLERLVMPIKGVLNN